MAGDTRLYDLLGVPPTASAAEIKKAYRSLALQHHPDKGGDVRRFQEMTAAHEILGNEERRRTYDEFGEEGLKQSMQAGGEQGADAASFGGVERLFDLLFGKAGGFGLRGFGPGRDARSRPSGEQVVAFQMKVSLEDVFAGATRAVAVLRTVACASCRGSGFSKPGVVRTCLSCQGLGVRIVERRLGLTLQTMQKTCDACGGVGQSIPLEARCQACGASGVRRERHVLEVQVPAGAKDGHQLLFQGQGHQLPGRPAGDVVCVLELVQHSRFQRVQDHLVHRARVTLGEALGGCEIKVEHLDGRILALRSKPGEVIKPGSWWRTPSEGMPVYGRSASRGDFFVFFEVDFPDRVNEEAAAQLALLLTDGRHFTQGTVAEKRGHQPPVVRKELERWDFDPGGPIPGPAWDRARL